MIALSEVRSLASFSVWTRPARNWLMAALKGYFDESADAGFFSVGGFIGEVQVWEPFESEWCEVLKELSFPYLHMKEMNKLAGVSPVWIEDDPGKERLGILLGRLAQVIGKSNLRGFGAVIWVKDLERFNSEKGRSIDPKAFAIYAAALAVRRWCVFRSIVTGHSDLT